MNMSYVRFQNTLIDLRDCHDALFIEEPLSDDETEAALKLLAVCKDIVDQFSESFIEGLRSE